MSLWDDVAVNPRANDDAVQDMDSTRNDGPHEKLSNAKTTSNTNGDGDEGAAKRALACNPCRERKVRCDREQPTCGRCVGRGHECTYSGPSKLSITKLELSRLLLNLQERMSQWIFTPMVSLPDLAPSALPSTAHTLVLFQL